MLTLEEIARNWKPPDSLGYSSLRPVRLARGGVALAALIAAFTIGGFVLGAVLAGRSRSQASDRELLNDQGLLTDATVLRVWRSGGEDSTRRVRYRLEVQGREFVSSPSVPRRIWDTLKVGSTIPVRYLPADPAINHPADWDVRVTPWWLAFLVPAMFGGLAWIMALLIRRQWRLLGEGRPAPGIVTGLKKSDKAVSVLYQFRLLSGAIHKGRGATGTSKSVPAVGAVVCVLYDPENPRRNSLYPLSLVRLEGGVKVDRMCGFK